MLNVVALIPAYEPDWRLVGFAESLVEQGFRHVVVVDDGSGEACRDIFKVLSKMPQCTVLHFESNYGKGAALKMGFMFVQMRMSDAIGVVTADCDGQHSVEDCRRLADELAKDPGRMYLGCRDFSLPGVPFRSRFGNRWSSITFLLLHFRWLPDSQTGLRAMPTSMLPMLIDVYGDRFEYEMGVLIKAAWKRVRISSVPISTIYENGNAGTHYRPILDTVRINLRVFSWLINLVVILAFAALVLMIVTEFVRLDMV